MLSTTQALAGGLERIAPNTGALSQQGRYLELSFATVAPELEGRGGLLDPLNAGTGDILGSYNLFGFAYKDDIDEDWFYSLVLDQPWGVQTVYPTLPTSGYSGTTAILNSDAFSGILGAHLTERVSAYGGVRLQSINAEAAFPFGGALGLAGPYNVVAESDEGVGYLFGMAYECPDIAFRLAATYYSEIQHSHRTVETVGASSTNTQTAYATPQAINLEFQSGIAEDTLAFGSVRWVDWSSFAISPPIFATGVGVSLVDFAEDWTTYTLGVGRKFCDFFSLAAICTYEPATNTQLTTLGPVDGRFSYGLAPSFTFQDVKVTLGVTRVELGRASNFASTQFDDGSAIAVGMRIGMQL